MLDKERIIPKLDYIRPAKLSDVVQIENLLKIGADIGSVKLRSAKEIESVIGNFVVMDDPENGGICACASLEVYDEAVPDMDIPGLAELRSVVSLRKGVGTLIVARALEPAKLKNIKDVFATTDNPDFFIKHCGFTFKKGGREIAWMNLERKSGEVFNDNGISVREANIDDIPVLAKLLAQDEENVLPMSEIKLRHALENKENKKNTYFLAINKSQQIIGCVGAYIYSTSISGGRPRMAEIKGLIVANGHKKDVVQNALLDKCWNKFKVADVVQAFVTGSEFRRIELIDTGYFNDVKGGKQVLWWDGK